MKQGSYSYMKTADGHKIRIAHWSPRIRRTEQGKTLKALILPGRASFLEKFEDVAYQLTQRGVDVWSLDWRGQGLSSRLLENHHKGHIDTYQTYLNDLDQFIAHHVQPDQAQYNLIIGHSMGGHLALKYLKSHQEFFHAGILACPMLDIKTGIYPKGFAKKTSRLLTRLGFGDRYIFGHGNYNPAHEPFEGNMLTHDREKYFAHREFQVRNPELILGGATFNWLHATFESIEEVLDESYLKTIHRPVLLIEAGKEMIVENKHIAYVKRTLPKCEHRYYEFSRHQLFMEVDEIQNQFWQDFDDFLLKSVQETQMELAKSPAVVAAAQTKKLPKRRLIKTPQLSGVQSVNAALAQNSDGLQPNL